MKEELKLVKLVTVSECGGEDFCSPRTEHKKLFCACLKKQKVRSCVDLVYMEFLAYEP
jgi:hypothetical protein